MQLTLLAVGIMAILALGYLAYGSFVARQYRISDGNVTPAVRREDGVDFVPTRPFYLLGQHFSAIAAAGPIVGPIAACMAFGWLPCLLWIVVGVVFIGAVHDFSALVASVRHDASSIAQVARANLGRRAWLVLTAFIYVALMYVIVAFTAVTAQTFQGKTEELVAAQGSFDKGGAVAAASTMYLGLALVMGLWQRAFRPPMWLQTLIFVPATLLAVYAGTRLDHLLVFDARTWYVAILVYCFVASLLPLWLLQQPRGYLGGWVLYLACAVGLVGVLFGGFTIKQPMVHTPSGGWAAAYRAFFAGSDGAPPVATLAFPFLFVTIACGACSGFHGLVCGGTTSKQIAKESHCKPIAFGAMLLEGLVAVLALGTVMIVAPADIGGRQPGVLYGDGLATFITRFLDPASVRAGNPSGSAVFTVAATFGAMAFSTFVFDTLDVSTRLGRYLLSEMLGRSSRALNIAASFVTAAIPLAVLWFTSEAGASSDRWRAYWTLFGTSNQLLAALTLLGVLVWLRRSGRRAWYVVIPMLFVMIVTLTALGLQGWAALSRGGARSNADIINGCAAAVLLVLAAVFVFDAVRALRMIPPAVDAK